ncbi:MAG: hypothetical protein ACYST0_03105 [Planctomycetota bacterium]|jgi:hypothetical protein
MKDWRKTLDLERTIILVSLLLMPVAGGWAYHLNKQIKVGEAALSTAKKPKGFVERIATLQKQITQFRQGEKAGDTKKDPGLYFEKAVREAQANAPDEATGGIRRQDFSIVVDRHPKKVAGKKNLQDTQLSMVFRKQGRTPYPIGRGFLNAFIFNVEQGGSRVWKLRNFRMVNQLYKDIRAKKEMPPEEFPDFWFPETVVFARREVVEKKK